MAYPLKPHLEENLERMVALMRDFSFAHCFTSVGDEHHVSRLPFVLDLENGVPKRLRAHLNSKNPQAEKLDNAPALVAFSGPDSYVSPNWRRSPDRGATWDYTSVSVWGRCRIRPEREFFENLIVDLAKLNEARFQGISDRKDWSLDSVSQEYVDRLFPALVSFEIDIERYNGISKLHQNFPKEDALSVAEHLENSDAHNAKSVASMIVDRNRDR